MSPRRVASTSISAAGSTITQQVQEPLEAIRVAGRARAGRGRDAVGGERGGGETRCLCRVEVALERDHVVRLQPFRAVASDLVDVRATVRERAGERVVRVLIVAARLHEVRERRRERDDRDQGEPAQHGPRL